MTFFDWHELATTPLHAWVLLTLYILMQFWVYWRGLGTDMRKASRVRTKSVSHGITYETHEVSVYSSWYTEANAITGLGILGMLAIVLMALCDVEVVLIPIVFLLAQFVSDGLDGLAAKRWGCHSDIGAFLDTFRDRMALIAMGVCLFTHGSLTAWVLPGILVVVIAELYSIVHSTLIAMRGLQLNSHGVGQIRQLVHIAMFGVTLNAMYLSTYHSETIATITSLAASGAASASLVAAIHYWAVSRKVP